MSRASYTTPSPNCARSFWGRSRTASFPKKTYGWREYAPYDAIVVAAAAPQVPEPLVSQLSATGRLVVPVGLPNRQRLLVVKKLPSGRTRTQDEGDVAYVPLVGKFGWEKAPVEERR